MKQRQSEGYSGHHRPTQEVKTMGDPVGTLIIFLMVVAEILKLGQ